MSLLTPDRRPVPPAPSHRRSAVRRTPPPPPGELSRRSHFWLRWAHVYISMFSLLLMLFFGVTGITLNHPDWTIFGADTATDTVFGSLPDELVISSPDSGGGEADGTRFLAVSQLVRERHGVSGEVTDFAMEGDQGSISYRAPGYGADLFFDTTTGRYELTTSRQGLLGIMNELHKGRDATSGWRWVIDISGALLVIIALTGLGIQFFMRKRRLRALSLSLAGAVLAVIAIVSAWP